MSTHALPSCRNLLSLRQPRAGKARPRPLWGLGLLGLGFLGLAATHAEAKSPSAKPVSAAPAPTVTSAAPAGATATPSSAVPAASSTTQSPAPAAPTSAGAASPASATPAPAATQIDAPPEISPAKQQMARDHFDKGVELYTQGNYPNAWLEFHSAYQVYPIVDLLNNLARCEVHMGRRREALEHYRQFIAARPTDQDADAIRQEIASLESELAREAGAGNQRAVEAPPIQRAQRFPVVPVFAGATTLATLLAGGVTLGLVNGRYDELQAFCGSGCPAEDVGVLRHQSYAGYGLLAAGGVAAVVTGISVYFELKSQKEGRLRTLSRLGTSSISLAFSRWRF